MAYNKKKTAVGQDVFYIHGYKCTHTNIRSNTSKTLPGLITVAYFQAESLHRGLIPESAGGQQGQQGNQGQQDNLRQELEDLDRKMAELELSREERCRKIMHRRVQQVNTLQELGK